MPKKAPSPETPLKEGEAVVLPAPHEGHYYGDATITTLSECGKYAVCDAAMSWSKKRHRVTILTALLKRRRTRRSSSTISPA